MIASLLLSVLSVGVQQRDSNWFLTLAPMIVRSAMESEAGNSAYVKTPDRPLLINVASFVVLGSMATTSDLNADEVVASLGQSFEDISPGRAIQCRPLQTLNDCHIQNNGLYLELNHVIRTLDGLEVLVTIKTTGGMEPYGGRTIDFRVVKMIFAWDNGRWVVLKRETVEQT